jgi:hypothetical protein
MRVAHSFWSGAAVAVLATACAGAAGSGTVLAPRSGADVAIDASERAALAAGRVFARPLEFERGSGNYVGGIAYGVVPASPERVLAALDDTGALAAMLPRTQRATLIDATPRARRIELHQGNSWVSATYTVSLETSEPGSLFFQLDPSRHHDIDDVYGYFRVERFDGTRSLVTIAAAVDVGSDFTNMLFGKRVQDVILSTPYAMRDYFARADLRPGDARVAENEIR